MQPQTFETTFGGKQLTLEVGGLAGQANGAVRAQYGETVVLATAVMSDKPREGINWLPLSVEFDEKFYAAGRIKGSRWVKREGRPADDAVLTARMIDRTLRPLFNKRLRNDIQIVITNLSFDEENDPDVVALIAASAALTISDIPWGGPIGAVRVGKTEDGLMHNPTYAEREESPLDIIASGPHGFINMLEGEAEQVPENTVAQAIASTEKERESIIAFQEKMQKAVGKEKSTQHLPQPDKELHNALKPRIDGKLEKALEESVKMDKVNDLKNAVIAELEEEYPDKENVKNEADLLFEEELDALVHRRILTEQKRADGRGAKEYRDLRVEVGTLPRTHGSAIFQRGSTQTLSVLTLGPPGLEQSLETMEFVGTKRYMHHYNFPPFSTGETGRMYTGRREIGHGALAEKAVLPVVPSKEDFPYAIRIVSEILSSNGSSSMASVCGSSLALMDAGVPVSSAVAGIAIGLMVEDNEDPEKNYTILTDIQGPEDHHGDMDLKVAGTKEGVTALQMDVKINGATSVILKEALNQAREARMGILEEMNTVIAEPKAKLSPHAPRILTFEINPEKIGEVIGPGGKIINKIIEQTGVEIDIEDSGQVFLTAEDGAADIERAMEWIKNIVKEVEPGEIYTGEVVNILDFGAFVRILPGKEGLVHISQLAPWHVNKVEDIVSEGDAVKVKVREIDEKGRINLTMKEFAEENNIKKQT